MRTNNDSVVRVLRPGQSFPDRWSLRSSFGWYDLAVQANTDQAFLCRLAGHVENGWDSASDPAIGSVGQGAHNQSGMSRGVRGFDF